VCGTTAASCYTGMLNATPPMIGAKYDGANATMAPLYLALYKGGRGGGTTTDNMPQTLAYCFSATPGTCPAGCPTPCGDLTSIQAWIAAGAPNN